jgi:hypothetical protein
MGQWLGQMTSIGFFGDSFCSELQYEFGDTKGNTYLKLVADAIGGGVVHLGRPGSSVWDTILLQFNAIKKAKTVNMPDICVFVWTDPARVYHPKIRDITASTAIHQSEVKSQNQALWKAAKDYYSQLMDMEKVDLEYRSLLYYVDNVLLKSLPGTTKIIHMWSFGYPSHLVSDAFSPNKIEYPHTWEHGVEIRPALVTLSDDHNRKWQHTNQEERANHFNGAEKNELIANWILTAIENYRDGLLLDHSTTVTEQFWK